MGYKILSHKNFRREIKKVSKGQQRKIYRAVVKLAMTPNRLPPNTKALRGRKDVYRVQFGQYRLIIFVDHKKEAILVLGVGSRGEVYKVMKRLLG